jgi:hypothetical protein
MWINTILELHTEEFNHALKHCKKLSLYDLNQYIQRHYKHLKDIIRLFILAVLMDY